MKTEYKICFIFFILLKIVILLKYNLLYQIVTGNYDFYQWKKNVLQKNLSFLKIMRIKNQSESLVHYYDGIPNGTMAFDVSILSDGEIIDKTFQEQYLNPEILGKTDSLPVKVGYFTTPRNILGPIQGESIFRFDYESRGKNNRQKEEYMKALRKEDLLQYQQIIRKYLHNQAKLLDVEYFMVDKCHRICIDLFYLLHFSLMPQPEDYRDIEIFLDAVIKFPFVKVNDISSLLQINNLKSFYQKSIHRISKIKQNKKHCLVYRWLQTELTEGDIFIELIHNILAMVSNWFNTLYPYLIKISLGTIPRLKLKEDNVRGYLQECFRLITPVRYASSKIKNNKKFKEQIPEKFQIVRDKIEMEGLYMHLYDLQVQNHNPMWWGQNANEFDATRFTDLSYQLQKPIPNKGKCPFLNSLRNAKVDCELPIYEKNGYLPFGDGYRRCPGEFLSMIFLEEIARFVADKKVELILHEGKTKSGRYIWGLIDENLKFKIH